MANRCSLWLHRLAVQRGLCVVMDTVSVPAAFGPMIAFLSVMVMMSLCAL
jgi:hypothetical protein